MSEKKETRKCDKCFEEAAKARAKAKPVDAQAEAEKAFKKMLETPLDAEEAKKMLAENEIQLSQLSVIRTKIVGELNNIDQQIANARFEQQIIYRRTLNKKADK